MTFYYGLTVLYSLTIQVRSTNYREYKSTVVIAELNFSTSLFASTGPNTFLHYTIWQIGKFSFKNEEEIKIEFDRADLQFNNKSSQTRFHILVERSKVRQYFKSIIYL